MIAPRIDALLEQVDSNYATVIVAAKRSAIADRLGFEIRHHALVMYGHCRQADCASRRKPNGG